VPSFNEVTQAEVNMEKAGNDREGAGVREGRYVNYFEIGHNAFEFLLHFGQLYCKESKARMHTRIVTSPFFAKKLMGVLKQAICQYEQSFGRVPEEENKPNTIEKKKNNQYLKVIKIP
jgi:hypothetical protein